MTAASASREAALKEASAWILVLYACESASFDSRKKSVGAVSVVELARLQG